MSRIAPEYASFPCPVVTASMGAMDPRDIPYHGHIVGTGEAAAHHFAVRVYYEDTDFSGVVYHARYLHFCERARSDFLARLGLDQRAAFAAGEGAFAVTAMECRFHKPARFDDALLVVSRITGSGGASFTLAQSVLRDGEMLFSAAVRAAFLSPDGRPRRLPKAWTAAIEAL